jgi:hypothetical protein
MMLPGDVPPVDVLRGLGLFTMALIFGARYVPWMQQRRRRIGAAVLVLYFGVGILVLLLAYVV